MQGIPDDDNDDDDLVQGDDDDASEDDDDDDDDYLVQGIPGLSSQGDTLKKIAAKKIRDQWSDNNYFPSNEEIFTVKTLVHSGILQNDVVERLKRRIQWTFAKVPCKTLVANLPDLTTAASLAFHGLLDSVYQIYLRDVDLASVPPEHLASLASCVTGRLDIDNVRNCDMTSILDSVKSEWLVISRQCLSNEETWALVRAMESRVERVELGDWGGMSLDIRALTQYSGQGECWMVQFYDETARRYREALRSWAWAQRINWRVMERGSGNRISLKRKLILSSLSPSPNKIQNLKSRRKGLTL